MSFVMVSGTEEALPVCIEERRQEQMRRMTLEVGNQLIKEGDVLRKFADNGQE